MDNNRNRKNIGIEDLIGLRTQLKEYLSKLDYCNPEHRQLAIYAMECYIKKYISPAMYLPDTTINGVMGIAIEGLALKVMFDENIESLERPEEKIKFVFRDCFKHEGTQQQRDDFWAAWLLKNAVGCVKSLYTFLNEPLIAGEDKGIAANVLKKEIQQLQKILKLPMPAVKGTIELLIETEQKVLAEWYK